MHEERNQSQIIRKDAKNCFVESLSDAFGKGKAHFAFATYDVNKPAGQRQTNNVHIYISIPELLELDGYIENRILNNFPGSIGTALEEMRESFFEDIPTVSELIEEENAGERHIFESIMQVMLSYAKFGEIKYGSEPLTDERVQTVFALLA